MWNNSLLFHKIKLGDGEITGQNVDKNSKKTHLEK